MHLSSDDCLTFFAISHNFSINQEGHIIYANISGFVMYEKTYSYIWFYCVSGCRGTCHTIRICPFLAEIMPKHRIPLYNNRMLIFI